MFVWVRELFELGSWGVGKLLSGKLGSCDFYSSRKLEKILVFPIPRYSTGAAKIPDIYKIDVNGT